MKVAIAHLVGEAPYSQSRHYADEIPKLKCELSAAYEERTWRNRLHKTKDGHVEIPGTSFANCQKTSCRRLKMQIPGKGKLEWTKYFEAGVMVPGNIVLPIKVDDVAHDRLFVPSDGRRGGGKRVTKIFPRIDEWDAKVTYYVLDDIITEDVFRQVLVAGGQLVGIGRFRPENCGFYGRFSVKTFQWLEGDAAMAKVA